MQIALIADIHGNLPALEAILDDLNHERPDQIVCLGDIGAMGPFPVETLERVRDLGCPVVMGNGDAAMLDPPSEPDDAENGNARRFWQMDRWCADQLGPEHVEFIGTFDQTVEIALEDGQTLLCFHGSPRSYDDVISATTPEDELEPMLDGCRATIMAGGHWHFQMLRRYKDMILFNPGSVGLPYDFSIDEEVFIPARAEYGLITADGDSLRVEQRRIHYDSSATIAAIRDLDFPHAEWWTGKWR